MFFLFIWFRSGVICVMYLVCNAKSVGRRSVVGLWLNRLVWYCRFLVFCRIIVFVFVGMSVFALVEIGF